MKEASLGAPTSDIPTTETGERKTSDNLSSLEVSLAKGRFTRLDYVIFGIYPFTLALGFCFSFGHSRSYFANSHNIVNLIFVKNGWLWTSLVFWAHLYELPISIPRKQQAIIRWSIATFIWVLVTQWAFGAPLTDRTMIWTGGICELAKAGVESDMSLGETSDKIAAYTNAACKKANGRWRGGHDLSGHVFILSHSSLFIWYEVLPILLQESELLSSTSTKAAFTLIGGWWWMLLMTAAYFHTWKEKLTGLLTGVIGWLLVYKLSPRIPALRPFLGMPCTA